MSRRTKVDMTQIKVIDGMIYKICTECKESKAIIDYHQHPMGMFGYNSVCKICANKRSRASELRIKFNLSTEEHREMYVKQNGKCLICKKQCEIMDTDHCHKTNKVRGLLCHNCNVGIGQFQDDPVLTEQATRYLSDFQHD